MREKTNNRIKNNCTNFYFFKPWPSWLLKVPPEQFASNSVKTQSRVCALKTLFQSIEDQIEHLSSYAGVVHTTAKQLISRRYKNENVYEMYTNACNSIVFHRQICTFATFLLPLSSYLVKLRTMLDWTAPYYSAPQSVTFDWQLLTTLTNHKDLF